MFSVISRKLLPSRFSKKSTCLLIHFENNFGIISKVQVIPHNKRFAYSSKSSGRKEFSPGRYVPSSRYVPPSQFEHTQESIVSTLKNKSFMNEEEWDNFKANLIDNETNVSDENFSSVVMNALLFSNQLDLSHSFLRYLKKSSVTPNFLTYLKYISLCSRHYRVVDQELILKFLDKVKLQIDESPVLDKKCAEYVIQGLCATEKWRESFKYFDKLIDSKPSREMCNAVACAAIRNDDEVLAWEILTKWMNNYDTISNRVIEEFLLVALKMQKSNNRQSDKFILKLFHYIEVRSVIISIDVAKLIEQYFMCHRLKWNIAYTKLSRRGICETCNRRLKFIDINSGEFQCLSDGFLKQAVMKSDIFINTSSKEFDKYMKFIDTHKPFHMVLDGLNAAHTYQGFQSRKSLSYHLLDIVKLLSRKSKKLLVLGRKHMLHWNESAMRRISERAQLFFTENISEDDPFIVYAALASGPHTLFLSDDLMRDHLSRLEDPKLIHLFKRWQQSHQVFIQCDKENSIKFVEPVRHSITLQGNMEDGWHIPFDDKIILDPYEELNNWLCIKLAV